MRRLFSGTTLGAFVVALAFVAIATAGLIFLQRELPGWFNLPIVIVAFLLAINVATQAAGFGAGIFAAIASFFCLNFFFIEPRGTLLVNNLTDLGLLALFLVVALLNSQFLGRAQRRAIEAAQRERDATRFYDLSLALISARDSSEVATTLSARLCEVLGAQSVHVALGAHDGARAVSSGQAPPTPPTHVERIFSARANLGEVRMWRSPPLSPGEERLVRTFAGEAALILERMRVADLETRSRVLEESDRLKTALLGSVSHELRTPLATIRAGTESLRSGLVAPDSAAGREMLDDVSDAAAHLTKLVNNMLDMSRIESGVLKPEREWADLEEILRSAALRLRGELASHALVLDWPADLPLVPVDPVQLDQVFTNLISNSVKYAPPGTPIDVIARAQDDQTVWVQVGNASPHLSTEDLGRIFDKFYRVTQADRVVGAGLGLPICKGIVEAHGGRIWAANRSDAERGVTFNFTLPLTWDGAAPKLPPPEASPAECAEAQP